MNYHKIEKTSIANGEGIRVVLWVSGCSLHCKGCQNPSTWDINSGKLFDEDAKKELFEALNKPYIQGITFSGGHPLEKENIEEIYNLILEIREKFPSKDIWLYTGLKWEDIIEPKHCKPNEIHLLRATIIKSCDIVVDGAYIEHLRDLRLKWRGSTNQRVIDVKKTIKGYNVVLYE